MATREEIRGGLAVVMASFEGRDYWRMTDADKEYWLTQASGSLNYLASKGVVIKVERDLPKNPNNTLETLSIEENESMSSRSFGYGEGQLDMRLAGYVAVESLLG